MFIKLDDHNWTQNINLWKTQQKYRTHFGQVYEDQDVPNDFLITINYECPSSQLIILWSYKNVTHGKFNGTNVSCYIDQLLFIQGC